MIYETLFRHLLFPAYERWVKRRATPACLRDLERTQWLPADRLEALALERLNALLAHAWAEVPALQERWRAAGLEPGPLASLADLGRYPVLGKADFKAAGEAMRARSWAGRTMRKTTGGSTGDPFAFEYTMDSYAWRTAAMWRGYAWAGARLGRRTAYLWGAAFDLEGMTGLRERLYHRAFNRKVFNCFSLSDEVFADYVAQMQAFRPEVIVAYVTPLGMLARWMVANGKRLPSVRAVVSAAEALDEPTRIAVREAFGIEAFNTYGCREFMLIGAECPAHDGLHATLDNLVVETVDDAGQPVRDRPGYVVVTDLHNHGMPFVRYRTGDVATLSSRACSCGRGLPLLEKIHGRELDLLRSRDGRLVPGEYIVYLCLGVTESVANYQVIQRDLDSLDVLLVPRGETVPEADLEKLRSGLRRAIGEQVSIRFELVKEIPLTRSGKRRVTQSFVGGLPGAGGGQ